MLTDALKWAESELMGSYAHLWPLTKILDIGGVTRTPLVSAGKLGMPLAEPNDFWQGCEIVLMPALELVLEYDIILSFLSFMDCSEAEVPPIPCHVHAGEVVGGHCTGQGKIEAYFFPPVDVPPYHLSLSAVKTRLGLRPNVEKEEVRCI